MDLQTLFKVLWKKKWILIIVPLVSVCGAFFIRVFGEWKYKSYAQLSTGITVNDELIDKGKFVNPYEVQIKFTNLMEMIKSRLALGLVSYRLLEHDLAGTEVPYRVIPDKKLKDKVHVDLQGNKENFQRLLTQKSADLQLLDANIPEQKMLQKVLEAYGYDYESVLEDVVINRVNNSDYIEVSYTSENPKLSAFVVNTLCGEFIRYYATINADRSNVSLGSLVSIVDQRKKYMDEKLEELKNFKSNNEMLNTGAESEAKIRQIKEYEDQVTEEGQKIRGLELALASLAVRIRDANAALNERPNERIITLRKRVNNLNEQYISGGQKDQALADTIARLRNEMQQYINTASDKPRLTASEVSALREKHEETKVDLEVARENQASLHKILNSMRYSIGSFANKEAVSQALEKEVEVAREEYLAAQARYNEARERMVTAKTTISQILVAEPAEKPESKKTVLFMIFSGGLSFAVCAFAIVLIELTDNRIKTPQRLKKLTKLPVAGVIPMIPKSEGEPNWNFFLQENGNGQTAELSHELRKIRFEIENRRAQVLLVTSTRKNQGKTFFVMALAHSLSLIRKRTLIIDTNLRNNSLTKMLVARVSLKQLMEHFNKSTKLLTGGAADKEAAESRNFITQTNNDLVDIIGNKTSQLSPLEILPGGDFKLLMDWLRQQYDYIILEGASLNEFSDSRELMGFVDLAIPVFDADGAVGDEDREALQYLRTLNSTLGPAVLNKYQSEKKS